MYHEDTDTPAVARTSNLNEELGQVQAALWACRYEADSARSGNTIPETIINPCALAHCSNYYCYNCFMALCLGPPG